MCVEDCTVVIFRIQEEEIVKEKEDVYIYLESFTMINKFAFLSTQRRK